MDNLSHQQPPSLEGGLSFENIEDTSQLQTYLIHPNRITNSTEMKIEPKPKLNFPPANSSQWKQIDAELNRLIPNIFNKSFFNGFSTSEISKKFDTWLYNYFLETFGITPPPETNKKK